ncbi:MAG: ABC transporter permease subunit [Betaproteobacteria bacterium]|nr:ABC transporter permease subunit [Betaproteobacteria bacterium]
MNRLRRIGRPLRSAAPLLLFAGLFVYPIVRLLLLPWFPALGPTQVAAHAEDAALNLEAIANTLRLGLTSTLVAVPVGVWFGWLLERRRWRGNAWLMAVLWMVLLTPSYLLTTAWEIVFSTRFLHHGLLADLFFSEAGIVALLSLKGLPFATLAARSSWAAIGAELEDAARILGLSAWRRRRVLLRVLLPAAGSAFAVVFAESIQEFGIPSTLGAQLHLRILTYAIYEHLATAPVQFAGAARLSWALVGLAALAGGVHLYLGKRHSGVLVHGRARPAAAVPCRPMERRAAGGALAVLATLGLALPGAALAYVAIWPTSVDATRPIRWDSLLYSTIYASLGAALAVAAAMSVVMSRRSGGARAGRLLEAVSLGNMAIPGLVLGAAYVIAFNDRWLPLYGTPLLLIVAYVAAQVPMLMRFLQGPLGQVHGNLSEAARLHGVPWASRLLEIHAPLLLSPFLWGWTLAFGQIFFELPISDLLYPAGRPPIGVALVTLNMQLRYGEEARLAFAGIGLALAIAVLLALLLRAASPVRRTEECAA